MKKRHLGWKTTAVLALAAAPLARAQSVRTWTGIGPDNFWSDALNWDGLPPGATDTAQFGDILNANTNVSLSGAQQPINTLLFNGTSTAYNLGATAGDIFNFDPAGTITLNGTVTAAQLISAAVQSNGTLTISNAGLGGLTLAGNMTAIGGGTFAFNGAGTTSLGIANGTSTITLGNPVTNGGDGLGQTLTLNAASGSLAIINSAIQDPGAGGGAASGKITVAGTGTLRFNAQSTYSGLTDFPNANKTIIQIAASSIVSNGTIISGPFGTGTFQPDSSTNAILQAYGADQTVANPVNLLGGGMTVQSAPTSGANADLTGPHNLTFSGPISVPGSGRTITANNVGTVLSFGSAASPSTFTFSTNTTAVTMTITVTNGATLAINDVIQDNPAPGSAADPITYVNNGSNGLGTIVITGANTYSGNTTFSSGATGSKGTFQIGVSSVMSGTNIVSGAFGKGTLTFTTNGNTPNVFEPINGDQVIANPINLNAGFWAANSGTVASSLTFSGPLTFTGINKTLTNNLLPGAALNLGDAASPSVLAMDGSLQLQSQQVPGSLYVVNDQIVDGTGTTKGTLTIQTNANVQLTNPLNSWTTGTLVQSGGNLSVSADGNLGAGTSTVTLNNGTLVSTGSFTSAARPLVLSGTGTAIAQVDVTGTNSVTWNGAVSGTNPGGLMKGTGTGTFILGGVSNTYTGPTTINGGTLGAAADGSLGNSTGGVAVNAGTFLATGSFTTARTINLANAASALDATAGNTLTLSGALTDAGTFNKGSNAGTVTLAQGGAYTTGAVNVAGGTLAVGNAAATPALNVTGNLTVADGARAALGPTGNTNPSAVVHTVGGTLNLNATGTLDLNNGLLLNSTTTPLAQVRSYITQARNGGSWNGVGGITSSTVQASPITLGMAYFSGANPANATLAAVPSMTNSAAIYVRPAQMGDFNGDGVVDRFDIRQFNTRGAFNDGGTNHDWADGDLNNDGVVDRFDIRAFNTAGNFNNGVTFAAQSATLTAKASSAAPAVAPINTPTTVGLSGDGKPDLVYDPGTGDVVFKYDGFVPPASSPIVEMEIDSSKGSLRPNNASQTVAGSTTTSADGKLIDFANLGPTAIADGVDLGQIFPTGSNALLLTTGDISVSLFLYHDQTGSSYFADVVGGTAGVPEPTSLAFLGVAAAGLLGRRRKRRQ